MRTGCHWSRAGLPGRRPHPAVAHRTVAHRTLAHRALAAASCAAALAASLTACSEPEDAPDAVGPADAYIELVLGTTEELATQKAIRFEESVAACMAEAGFEYLPNLAGHIFVDDSAIDPPLDSREFAEQYGYGLASGPEGTRGTTSAKDDPNVEIMADMSPAELAEYELAMAGPQLEEDAASDDAGGEPDWAHYGCYGRAMLEVYRSGPDTDSTLVALQEEIERIETEVVPTDADVVAADAAWAECMADAGFPGYARQPEAEERESERFDASGGGGGEIGDDGKTDSEREEVAREIPLATADWDCTDRVGYNDVVARVRDAAQQEYVDAHRDELDAWVERWTQDQQTEDEG